MSNKWTALTSAETAELSKRMLAAEASIVAHRASLIHLAHESADDDTLAHCPWCGSGAITGGANGVVECEYCGKHFTVQLQPEFAAMPQTVNGQPYDIPGMPGSGPDAGAAADQATTDTDDAQDDVTDPDDAAGVVPDDTDPTKVPVMSSYVLVGAGGDTVAALPREAALRRLALDYADDRAVVLRVLKAESGS